MIGKATIAREICDAFDKNICRAMVQGLARSGSFSLRLAFSSETLASSILPSFICAKGDDCDLEVLFLTSTDIDLSHLIPGSGKDNRVLTGKHEYAVWYSGDLPLLYLMDRKSRRAVVWLAGSAAPSWVRSRPALPLIHAMSVGTPWTAAHGAAVGRNGRFLLLAGRGRTGKTTAALACIRAGWDYAGDDYVFADTQTGYVEPLYSTARLRMDMASVFEDLLHTSFEVSQDGGESRHELRLATHFAKTSIRGGSLAAILLLRRSGAAVPTFAPARRSDAFAALFAVTTIELPGWPQLVAEKLATLIGMAPVYFVDTGENPDAIPDALAGFLNAG